MDIVYEIDLSDVQHRAIQALRNQSFIHHQVSRSYFKQLPHMRALQYEGNQLVGYFGLDYRVVKVGEKVHKVLGVIDFCVDESLRRRGIGSRMLGDLTTFAKNKDVDFIILLSEFETFYSALGYKKTEGSHSWLRIHEHTSYGVAVEHIDELYVKSINGKRWGVGHVDWLGYMY